MIDLNSGFPARRENSPWTDDLWCVFNGARILIAPLDWGLGHAARCIPIIRRLIELDAHPILGASDGPLALLRKEFPALEHVIIPGHVIEYSSNNDQVGILAKQFPAMLGSIRNELLLTRKLQKELKLDAIISDQRFGIRSSLVPSILITHQLFPKAPLAMKILQRINHHLIGKFDRCWIMDDENEPGLAGELSHGDRLPDNTRYIGPQSRFTKANKVSDQRSRVMAILSGPEPQRTKLENILIPQLLQLEGRQLLVQGRPDRSTEMIRDDLTIVSHLESERMSQQMQNADLIVSRSGYTTIMDLAVLEKPALLIPTPGQPEQEYLAKLHSSSSSFIVQKQAEIDLKKALIDLVRIPHGDRPRIMDRTAPDVALEELHRMIQES